MGIKAHHFEIVQGITMRGRALDFACSCFNSEQGHHPARNNVDEVEDSLVGFSKEVLGLSLVEDNLGQFFLSMTETETNKPKGVTKSDRHRRQQFKGEPLEEGETC